MVGVPKDIVMDGGAVMGAVSEAELFEEFVSPVIVTDAVFVICAGAFEAT